MALIPMCLRVETPDGRAVEEYCIRDGEIEVRQLQGYATERDREWHPVTPEQLTDHVNHNTVVAQWLERRLGWRRLLRACLAEELSLYQADSLHNGEQGQAA